MAKRTKAQRRAAAKKSWQERKERAAKAAKVAPAPIAPAVPPLPPPEVAVKYLAEPRIAYAVKEGEDIFICFGQGKRLNREHVAETTAKKLLRELTAILV